MRTILRANAEVQIHHDLSSLTRAVASHFQQTVQASVAAGKQFSAALAGGKTPRGIYELIANDEASGACKLPWDKIHIFFGDERHVPPDHADSNYRMAQEAMLSKVAIPEANVHRIPAEQHAVEAADQYQQTLRAYFQLEPGAAPQFDLVLLGLGGDGHTVSLFPNTEALKANERLVCANWIPKSHNYRITLTLPVLNAASQVVFVVAGPEKAAVMQQVFHSKPPVPLPAQRVHPIKGKLIWMLDRPAAAELV